MFKQSNGRGGLFYVVDDPALFKGVTSLIQGETATISLERESRGELDGIDGRNRHPDDQQLVHCHVSDDGCAAGGLQAAAEAHVFNKERTSRSGR
jgi:hypothetical protein